MPLYLKGNSLLRQSPASLASTASCCCSEDTKACFCGDPCLYQVAVTAPLQVGPVPVLPCGQSESQATVLANEFLCTECGEPYIFPGATEPYLQGSGVSVNAYSPSTYGWDGPRGTAFCYAEIAQVDQGDGNFLQSAQISAQLHCGISPDGTPGFFVEVFFTASVAPVFNATKAKAIRKSKTILLESLCGKQQNSLCADIATDNKWANWLGDSLEVAATWDSVNGQSWGTTSVLEQFNDDNYIGECFDALVAGFSAAFKFYKRPSCRIVACNCSTDLDGLKATFEGKEFTLGTEEPYNEFFSGYELVTTHYKDFSGDYIFEKYKVLDTPAGAIGDVQLVKVFCEVDTEADPQVPRWYAEFVSICRTVEANTNVSAETKRTEIGYFQCAESAGCAGRSEGDPVPLGTAQEIEEIPGSPETSSGKDSCTPPARADLTIFEDCG